MGDVHNPRGFTVGNFVWSFVSFVALTAFSVAAAVANQNGSRPFAIIAAVLSGGLAVMTAVAIVKLRRSQKRARASE
jgi:hypothetical protein